MNPKAKDAYCSLAAVGMIAVCDVDGDVHYIPWMQVRDMTDWPSKWGANVSALSLSASGTQRIQFKVGVPLAQLVDLYQQACAGAMVDLRALSGAEVYAQEASDPQPQPDPQPKDVPEPEPQPHAPLTRWQGQMILLPSGQLMRINGKKPNF